MMRTAFLTLFLALLVIACDDDPVDGDADIVDDVDADADTNDAGDGDVDENSDSDVNNIDADSPIEDADDDACEDNDGDGRCVENDCDDSLETGRTCFAGCLVFYVDNDGDGHGDPDDTMTACVTPDGYAPGATDCDDTLTGHWSDCGLCLDADGDDHGDSCDLGEDCDDTIFTGSSCYDGCASYFIDRDSDDFGDASVSAIACELPVGHAELVGDCDDNAPDVYPGAVELCGDDVDNDCSGEDRLCPEPGDILITEVMQDPSAMGDSEGEWIELYNVTDTVVDLQGLVLRDDDTDLHHIATALVIEAGGYLVLGRTATAAPSVDYVYADFLLANDDDEVTLATFGTDGTDGTELSSVRYDAGITFPDPMGASMNLDPRLYDVTAAAVGGSWCEARTPFGFGDLGTPGLSNDECLWPPQLDLVEPTEGVSGGGELVTLFGPHFFDITNVYFDGVSSAFVVGSPWEINSTAPPHEVGWVDVSVANGLGTDVLVGGFLYTGTTDALDWCTILAPSSTTTTAGIPTESIYGSVRLAGVTEAPGQGSGVAAQIGVGPIDSDPASGIGWVWSSALYYRDDGTDDAYTSDLTVLLPGSYAFAYRFSIDSGLTFLYCDTDGSSAVDPYSPAAQGSLTVEP